MSLSVREGNPEDIQSFDDLLTKDVEIITPNPATSGGAKWNIMAIYGSQIEAGKSEEEALDAVATVLEKTSVLDDSRPRLAADVRQRQGRRADRLRERGHPGPGRGHRARVRASRRRRSRSRTPAPSRPRPRTPRPRRRSSTSSSRMRASRSSPTTATARSTESVLAENTDKFPEVPGQFTIADFGGWEKVDDGVLRRRDRQGHADPERAGRPARVEELESTE